VLAIVKRSDDQKVFAVLPKQWIVERLFPHLMRSTAWPVIMNAGRPAPRRWSSGR
jgi:hypothetical protein